MKFTLPVVVTLALISATASAHHSFVTTYDPSQAIELRGTVVEYSLRSPHTFIVLDVARDEGEVEMIEVEMHSLPVLRREGFSADTFEPGDEISVVAWPNRVPTNPLVFGIAVTTQDGRTRGGAPTPGGDHTQELNDTAAAPDNAVGIAKLHGRWLAPIPTVNYGESPLPLSAAGLAAWGSYDPQLSPANTCEAENIPGVFYAPYMTEIQVTAQEVVLHHETYNIVRTIPRGGEPKLAEPSGLFGTVVGRADGDVFVIESSGYPESRWGIALAFDTNGAGADVPSSAQKKVIERYAVSDDGETLRVDYTLEDPVYLTESYSSFVEFSRVADDAQMYEYECELDSAARFSRDP